MATEYHPPTVGHGGGTLRCGREGRSLACRQPLIGLHGAGTVSIALVAPCQDPLVSGVLCFQSSLFPFAALSDSYSAILPV